MKRIAMQPPAVWMIIFGLLGFAAGALAPACQSNTVVCRPGTSRCGLGCSDFKSDSLNCGGCGVACQSLQICQDSACQCRPGSVLCGASCVNTISDRQNCGGCGAACQPSEVCDPPGRCRAQCTLPLTNCAGGCVNLQSDPLNCGQCGRTCLAGQSCRAGSCTSDVVAACVSTASVVGIQAIADVAGASVGFGSAPQALASLRGVLLEGDGADLKVEQMRLQDFSVLTNVTDAGFSPNHILVDDRDDQYVYIVNGDAFADAGGAPNSTLQVLQRTGDVAADAGLTLSTIATLSFDAGDPPQAVTKLGNNLYIPLFLGEVAEVDVSNPAAPHTARTFDLRTLTLPRFDAGVPTFPRPSGVAAYGGAVYVALRNQDAAGAPGGPGVLARLNLVSGPPEAILLPNTCLTAYWLATAADAGNTLYVSCNGRAQRDAGYLTSVDSSGAVAISADGGMAMWSGGCDAGAACFPALPRRFAVVGSRLYLGDELGRVFVLENVDGGLVERRGYNSGTGGLPISACTSSATGSAIVNDIIAVP